MNLLKYGWTKIKRYAQNPLSQAAQLVEPSRPAPSLISSASRDDRLSASPSSDAVAVPAFADFLCTREGRIHEIAQLCDLPPDSPFNEGVVVGCLRRFCHLCFLVPASQESHDQHPGGLVDHTLAVCLQTIRDARTSRAWNHLDRLALLLLCLCHDIGRILQVRVTATLDGRTEIWNPEEAMSTWCERNHIARLSMTWIPGRPTLGAFAAEPMGMFFLPRICPLGLPSIIGIDRCNFMLYAFSRQIGVPAIDYHAPFKRADRDCAARGKPVKTDVPFPDAFWHALRAAIQSGAVTVNGDDADVYVSTTHSVVTLPKEKTTNGQAWSIACATLERRVDVTDPLGLSDRMLSDATAPFLRWFGSESCAFRAKHVIVTDARPGKLAVVIPNAVLWAEDIVAERIPPCSARLGFIRPNGGLSITAADVGFQSQDHMNIDAHIGGAPSSCMGEERAALLGFIHNLHVVDLRMMCERIRDDMDLAECLRKRPPTEGFDEVITSDRVVDESESDF